jgi:alginate production protein
VAVGSFLGVAASSAGAVDIDTTFKASVTGEADSGRDLGLQQRSDQQQVYLDLTPWAHFQFSPDTSAYVRARAFVPSGSVLPQGNTNNNVGASSSAYIGLKEAWIDYGGITSYPGESLRVGRQRTREDSAEWWDDDLDSVRWMFNTTLLQSEMAVAHQFSTYRSDGAPLPFKQQNRIYLLGSVSGEVLPMQRIGLRVVHADDSNHLPAAGETLGSNDRSDKEHLTWIGLFADNHAYDAETAPALSYWESTSYLTGHRRTLQLAPGRLVDSEVSKNASAFSGELGVRYRLSSTDWPLQFGAAIAAASGGGLRQYEQSGLQSNYSRFTGTRALINRFNDAYRVELGNLRAYTGFASMTKGDYDFSAIYNYFQRVNDNQPIISDALLVSPINTSADLGSGYDLVVTRYFGARHEQPRYLQGETVETWLRLRGSVFEPGNAYGTNAKTEYRVALEFTLWY